MTATAEDRAIVREIMGDALLLIQSTVHLEPMELVAMLLNLTIYTARTAGVPSKMLRDGWQCILDLAVSDGPWDMGGN